MPSRPRSGPAAARRAGIGRARRVPRRTGRDHALGKAATVSRNSRCSSGGRDPLSARYRPQYDATRERRLARPLCRCDRARRALIGSGDMLAVHPEPIQRGLAIALTKAGYRAGARYVDVLETDPRITRARALLAPEDTLDWRPASEDARMRELVREGAGIVWIAGSEDPRRSPTCRRRTPCAASPIAPGCRLPARRRSRRCRFASWPGRRRRGPLRSTPSSRPTPPSRRSATTCCTSPASARRSAGRLAAAREHLAARAKRLAALDLARSG